MTIDLAEATDTEVDWRYPVEDGHCYQCAYVHSWEPAPGTFCNSYVQPRPLQDYVLSIACRIPELGATLSEWGLVETTIARALARMLSQWADSAEHLSEMAAEGR